jgi:hypothetical protein
MMVMAVRTGPTGAADATNTGQAFVVCLEPALPGTAVAQIVIGAPIGLCGMFDAEDSRKNTKDKYRKLHGSHLFCFC